IRHLHSFPTRRSSDLTPSRVIPVRTVLSRRRITTVRGRGLSSGLSSSSRAKNGETAMLKKVPYVALLVSDQDKALDFYTNVVGRSEEHTSELQSRSDL